MTPTQTASVLLIAGSLTFFVGAAIGVPGVFTQRDPDVRLRMLRDRARSWAIAQPLYGLGAGLCALGVGALARDANGESRVLLVLASALLLAGSLAWAWSLYLRGTRVEEFAFGRLPGWPFALYVLATIAGLALLGLGLVLGDFPSWLGWLVLGADALYLVGYLRFGDIPPFLFYVLLLIVGITILW